MDSTHNLTIPEQLVLIHTSFSSSKAVAELTRACWALKLPWPLATVAMCGVQGLADIEKQVALGGGRVPLTLANGKKSPAPAL